jgi:hypothetical protein
MDNLGGDIHYHQSILAVKESHKGQVRQQLGVRLPQVLAV